MKRAMVLAVLMAICVLVAATAGGVSFWIAFLRGDVPPSDPAATLSIAGGDGASIPPASPEEQGLDAGALAAAEASARQLGASAFAVARRGHAVHVWSAAGAEARVRSVLLSRLVIGAGEARLGASGLLNWSRAPGGEGSSSNPWSASSRRRYGPTLSLPLTDPTSWTSRLSVELWRPLAARDALVERDANGAPRLHCCVWVRPRDALALSSALIAGGQVNGERLMDAASAARVLQELDDGVPPRGAEPFGARPARVWRDAEGTRLYSFPAQDLVILLVRADESRLTDETAIAHEVLRGIVDSTAAPDKAPVAHDLVPAH